MNTSFVTLRYVLKFHLYSGRTMCEWGNALRKAANPLKAHEVESKPNIGAGWHLPFLNSPCQSAGPRLHSVRRSVPSISLRTSPQPPDYWSNSPRWSTFHGHGTGVDPWFVPVTHSYRALTDCIVDPSPTKNISSHTTASKSGVYTRFKLKLLIVAKWRNKLGFFTAYHLKVRW